MNDDNLDEFVGKIPELEGGVRVFRIEPTNERIRIPDFSPPAVLKRFQRAQEQLDALRETSVDRFCRLWLDALKRSLKDDPPKNWDGGTRKVHKFVGRR